jgi:hypothetical protein
MATEIIQAIRRAVAIEHEIEVSAIALLKMGSIPKTSSGKIQRQASRQHFLTRNLEIIHLWQQETTREEPNTHVTMQPPSVAVSQSNQTQPVLTIPQAALEQQIAAIWQELLPATRIGIYDNFFDLGGTSLLLTEAHTRLCKLLNQDLSLVETFFQYPTIQALATFLIQRQQLPTITDESEQQRARISLHQKTLAQQRQARIRHRSTDTLPKNLG